jgi:broad specificity phosphatase PhoE
MTTIFLVRHGETDWNAQHRWQGQADTQLNDRGRAQAYSLRDRLADVPFQAAYASDLRRASETARILVAGRDLRITIDPALRELDIGSWEGLTKAEVTERFGDRRRPDGETKQAFRRRVLNAIERIGRAHEGAKVLVVAHAGTARTVERALLGQSANTIANGDFYVIYVDEGRLLAIESVRDPGSSE